MAVSYTHLRAHETKANLVCRLLLEKKNEKTVTQFFRKLAAERPLQDIRDEYNYPKKKGIKDECSRLLEASTMKSRRGFVFFLMMRRTPRSTQSRSSAAS
eukprot:Lankesteria_metandrocarpae@DN6184_c0_g1_i1.p2